MKLFRKLLVWSCGWTNGQIGVLIFSGLFWMGVGFYELHQYRQARAAADYWREFAITNSVYQAKP